MIDKNTLSPFLWGLFLIGYLYDLLFDQQRIYHDIGHDPWKKFEQSGSALHSTREKSRPIVYKEFPDIVPLALECFIPNILLIPGYQVTHNQLSINQQADSTALVVNLGSKTIKTLTMISRYYIILLLVVGSLVSQHG